MKKSISLVLLACLIPAIAFYAFDNYKRRAENKAWNDYENKFINCELLELKDVEEIISLKSYEQKKDIASIVKRIINNYGAYYYPQLTLEHGNFYIEQNTPGSNTNHRTNQKQLSLLDQCIRNVESDRVS